MSQSKNKRRRFLAEHPICCFCGGSTASETIDHVPCRACFRGRNYPETFEFPACERCNDASRQDEVVFPFYVRMVDNTTAGNDDTEIRKLVSGLANNLPELMPSRTKDVRTIRRTLARMGLSPAPGMFLNELPMVAIPNAVHDRIRRYARKIACALSYREKSRAVSADHLIFAHWGQQQDRAFVESVEGFLAMPKLEIGKRRNVDIGDQFAYRCNFADDPDVFGMIAQFGSGIMLTCLIAPPDFVDRLKADTAATGLSENGEWVAVSDLYA